MPILQITAPIYLLIALGFAAVRLEWLAPADLRLLGRLSIQLLLPALLLRGVASQPLADVLRWDYLGLCLAGQVLAAVAVLGFAGGVRGRPLPFAAVQAMGAACPNSAFIGYPIVLDLLGPQVAAQALAMNTLVENLLVIPLLLALAEGGRTGHDAWTTLRQALQGVARNPMVLAVAAGLALSALGWRLPLPIDKALGILAAGAAPLALLVIGGSLVGVRLAGVRSDLAVVAAGKLLLHPVAVAGLVALLAPRLSPQPLGQALVLSAAMPMLGIYAVLAQRAGQAGFAAAALVVTTTLSFLTVSGLAAWLAA